MVSVTEGPGQSLSQGVAALALDLVALYLRFCLTGVFGRERRRRFPSSLSLGFSAVETVLVGTVKCCCASQKFVPSIQNNSKERFLAVGTGCVKSSVVLGYVCFCCVCISSPVPLPWEWWWLPKLLQGQSFLEIKKKGQHVVKRHSRTDSPCVKIVSSYKILLFSEQERREVVKFLTED